jgi:ABC-2 type transport system permease protein
VKIAVNLAFSIVPAFAGVIAFAIITRINLISSVLLALYALFIPLLASNVGLLVNVLFPMMKWDNPTKPVKQGVSILLATLVGFVYTVLQFSIVYFIPLPVNALIGICLAFTVVLSIASYLLVYFKGEEWLIKKLG